MKDSKLRYKSLYEEIGYTFKNDALLEESLTHASSGSSITYDRLEFLGDRVIGLIVARLLFDLFPHASSGELTTRYAELVRKTTLVELASEIGLENYIKSSLRRSEVSLLLCDACESFIAAIYLDGGLEVAGELVKSFFRPRSLKRSWATLKDAKSRLQEIVQALGKTAPRYSVVGRAGPHHAPTLYVNVHVDGLPLVKAFGSSKKSAEQNAAEALLELLQGERN